MLDNKLLTFLSLCQTKSFTKTAEQLHITQPAVSQHIKALEKEYNVSLYYYEGRKFNLTAAGIYLFQFANSIHLDSERMRSQLSFVSADVRELRVGAELATGESFFYDLLVAFIKKNPETNISVIIDNSSTLSRMLEDGDLDFLIIDESFSKSEFEYHTLCSGTTVCVCSPDHPLADKTVSIEDLYDNTLILGVENTPSRMRLDIIFQENGISAFSFPHRIEITNGLAVVKQLVHHNVGIAFHYTSAVLKELRSGYLKKIIINDFFERHSYNLVFVRNSYFRPSQVYFINFCQDFLHELDIKLSE
ncbi:MAG: LysR family transcriptional regulator [Saccharofermentanales bacterium]|nr:LysR family transcriptional regulator [Bacillota bacterium]